MPHPSPRPSRLPDQLKDLQILEAAGRLGSTTPDQVVSLMTGQIPSEISTVDAIRMQERTAKLARQGLLESCLTFTSCTALRPTERYLYRLTEKGMTFAAALPGTPWRAVNAVAVHADPKLEGWADEEVVRRESYPGFSNRKHVRGVLNAVMKDRYLERKFALEPHTKPRYVQVLTLTAEGRDKVADHFAARGIPTPLLPKSARQDQVIHHLMTVHVALHLLSFYEGELVVLKGDEQLRSELYAGQAFQQGSEFETLADGKLVFVEPHNRKRVTAYIEIFTKNYSDEQIIEKYKNLHPDTLFVATTPRLQERIRLLEQATPHLLRDPLTSPPAEPQAAK